MRKWYELRELSRHHGHLLLHVQELLLLLLVLGDVFLSDPEHDFPRQVHPLILFLMYEVAVLAPCAARRPVVQSARHRAVILRLQHGNGLWLLLHLLILLLLRFEVEVFGLVVHLSLVSGREHDGVVAQVVLHEQLVQLLSHFGPHVSAHGFALVRHRQHVLMCLFVQSLQDLQQHIPVLQDALRVLQDYLRQLPQNQERLVEQIVHLNQVTLYRGRVRQLQLFLVGQFEELIARVVRRLVRVVEHLGYGSLPRGLSLTLRRQCRFPVSCHGNHPVTDHRLHVLDLGLDPRTGQRLHLLQQLACSAASQN